MSIEVIAAVLFGVALVHTFATKLCHDLAQRHPRHAGLFHLLGEVEVVFGFWAAVLIAAIALVAGSSVAVAYAETRQYTEPLFVFVVTRDSLVIVQLCRTWVGRRLPFGSALRCARLRLRHGGQVLRDRRCR